MSGVPHPGPPPGDGHRPSDPHRPHDAGRAHERDLWPRDFGRDGVSGLVTLDRALRSRDVSRPTAADEVTAEEALAELLARVEGRPRSRQDRGGSGHQPVPHPPPQRSDS